MSDRAALAPTVTLFARLLLRELDADLLTQLQHPDVAAALRDLEVGVPSPDELEALRADYADLFVLPQRGAPPVASLWLEGRYQGESTAALQRVTEATGYAFDGGAAQAPKDHLGCLLLLWVAALEQDPALSRDLALQLQGWVPRALAQPAADGGFYGQVARAVVALLPEL